MKLRALLGLASFATITLSCTHAASRDDAGRAATRPLKRLEKLSEVGQLSLADGTVAGSPIVIDLATSPNPSVSWDTTACLSALDDATIIGQAVCVGDAAKTATVTAANARQTCSTDPSYTAAGPSTPLTIPGCAELDVSFYGFSPALSISIVPGS